MAKKILGLGLLQVAGADVGSTVPAGTAGIDMTLFSGAMKVRMWMAEITVTGNADDVFVWGSTPGGNIDDHSDDVWGKHEDEYGTYPLGKVATALPAGTYHFMIDGLGVYTQVAFTRGGAGGSTVKAKLFEILEGERGN